ncbi:glutathione transferase GstA [Vulcaniibacterium gelatinicum]|uniref:glutathione transferase GstA n=1 Tax=Vulcaniibacterium gelatinicum TaxID=2598725 RepID=UPI0011C98098|nr:glutathione transferase GstA [Vulcaniibacterium gelatinicum]
MKLYYSPGACSFSPHIVARELGIPLQLEKVDTRTKRTETGRDFLEINPKGYVPALELDDGQVLTEGPAIVQYLADLRPEAGLAPANGTFERYRLQEMLGYINSEIHKAYSPLFDPNAPAQVRQERQDYLRKRYALLEALLARQPYLLGERFSVADAYLYTVTNWAGYVKLDLSGFPALAQFQQRIAARPAVQAAHEAERNGKQQVA